MTNNNYMARVHAMAVKISNHTTAPLYQILFYVREAFHLEGAIEVEADDLSKRVKDFQVWYADRG